MPASKSLMMYWCTSDKATNNRPKQCVFLSIDMHTRLSGFHIHVGSNFNTWSAVVTVLMCMVRCLIHCLVNESHCHPASLYAYKKIASPCPCHVRAHNIVFKLENCIHVHWKKSQYSVDYMKLNFHDTYIKHLSMWLAGKPITPFTFKSSFLATTYFILSSNTENANLIKH